MMRVTSGSCGRHAVAGIVLAGSIAVLGACKGGESDALQAPDAASDATVVEPESGFDASSADASSADAPFADASEGAPSEVLAHLEDWPLPNRDYENTRAAFGGPIDSASIGDLQEAWRLPFEDAGPFGYVTSNPLVLGDTVYIQDMGSHVYALDRERGEPRWVHRDGRTTVGPNGVAVGFGLVFANGGDREVVALEAADGEVRWRFSPQLTSSEGIDIQPIAYGGSVFVSTVPGSLRGAYLGGSRGVIFALDALSGAERWSFDTVGSDDLWGDPELNAGGGAWYPPLVDPERSMTYWGTGNPAPFPGLPDSPNGESRPGPNLYTSSVVALDLARGELAWFHQERPHDLFDWDFQNSPILVRASADSDHRELIVGSGKTGTVVALDPLDGSLVWRAKVGDHENSELEHLPEDELVTVSPGLFGGVLTAAAYAEGVVYVPVVNAPARFSAASLEPSTGVARGALVALDVHEGSLLWERELAAPCYGAALVVNDLVLTSDAAGRVYAFARDGGDEVWHYDAPAGINAPLAVAGDLLLVPAGATATQPALIALRLP